MEHVYIVTDDAVSVMDTSTGESVKFYSDDSRYAEALEMIRNEDFESVFTLDVKHVITSFFEVEEAEDDYGNITVAIEDGFGFVTLHNHNDLKVPLQDALTKRIMKMAELGLDPRPMINFISNLYDNPSATAIAELYLFIDACDLPITEDGNFIAYKMVREDYMDIYSGTVSNKIGEEPSMPRSMVDDRRSITCSQGLHFCSKAYLPHYGTGTGTRCMLVSINPANVVSIPSDYNNAKGRTWTYEVVGEVDGNWRVALPEKDFTTAPVVTAKAAPLPVVSSYVDDFDNFDDFDDFDDLDDNKDNDFTSEFTQGYADGYRHGKNKEQFVPANPLSTSVEAVQYDMGYDAGYRDGRGKKKKLVK